jgi:hypothetical protein
LVAQQPFTAAMNAGVTESLMSFEQLFDAVMGNAA